MSIPIDSNYFNQLISKADAAALASIARDQAALVESEGDICEECGHTAGTGACFYCKAD